MNISDRIITIAERFFRTDLRYLLKGGGWLAGAQITISLLAFGVSIAFGHFVPKETYGTYRYLISIFWSLAAFGLSGVPTALARSIVRGDSKAYGKALRLSMIGALPVAVGSAGLAAYYFLNGNLLLAYGCVVIAIIGPFMQAAYLFGPYLEGKKLFRENAISGIILNLIPSIVLAGLMLFTHSPIAFLIAYLGGSVLTGSMISIFVVRRFAVRTSMIEDDHMTSYGLHLSVMNILFTLSQQADKLLVFHLLGPVSLAVYSFAVAIPDQVRAIVGNLETLAFPKFAQRTLDEILPTLGRRILGFTGFIVLGVIAYIFAAPYIFQALLPAYMDSVFISQIYALSLIPTGSIVPVSILQAQSAKRELYIYNILVPVLQIGTLVAGIAAYGLIGAIAARVITRFATLLISLILIQTYKHRLKNDV